MAEPATAAAQAEKPASPRADLHDAIGWILFGIAVLIGSITMDRLENQNINPVTVPGLLPGLLGIGMILLGGVLGVRSWRRGALQEPRRPTTALERQEHKRVAIAVALCAGYGLVLVGHGIPFWLASTVYVTVSILVFRRISPNPAERPWSNRAAVKALVIGLCASVVTWLVFEKVFLVRLP